MRHLAGGSEDGRGCPKIYDEESDTVAVQGPVVTDEEVASVMFPEPHEAVVRIPRAMLLEAAARLAALTGS